MRIPVKPPAMPNFDLFPDLLPAGRSRVARLRLVATNNTMRDKPLYRFHGSRCGSKTGWLKTPTASEAKRGLPRTTCDGETVFWKTPEPNNHPR